MKKRTNKKGDLLANSVKIVKLKGGLGNQMFQYSFAKWLEKNTNSEIRLDSSFFQSLDGDEIRKPRIFDFNISIKIASKSELMNTLVFKPKSYSHKLLYKLTVFCEKFLNKKYYLEKGRAYKPNMETNSYSYYDGYWQSYFYPQEIYNLIKEDFTPKTISSKTTSMIETIEKNNAVFIGVRRGDYGAEKKHYGEMTLAYYINAIKYIEGRVNNPVFYVFTNDIEWCRTNLLPLTSNMIIREKEDQVSDFEELVLMSHFKHAIISNSTFNWWGAFLINNPNKIVCTPNKWFYDDVKIDIIPNDWVKINNF